ncbi:MAG: hypothetical protein LBC40_05820, partial [Dysgonamonadaceae bacterium]|nr:hypothetical protein [Dysgonamonadaceae bacterium]
MKTIKQSLKTLFLTCFLSALPLFPFFAANYYWTGANSNIFNNAGNWKTDTQNPAPDYPRQDDDVFFDIVTPQMTVRIQNSMNVHSITCTQSGYTLQLNNTLNVYGNLLLNGN